MSQLRYAVDESGVVWSLRGNTLAVPLDESYEEMRLIGLHDYSAYAYDLLRWTKKIPTRIKNAHRKFWGLKPLPKTTPHIPMQVLTHAARRW